MGIIMKIAATLVAAMSRCRIARESVRTASDESAKADHYHEDGDHERSLQEAPLQGRAEQGVESLAVGLVSVEFAHQLRRGEVQWSEAV